MLECILRHKKRHDFRTLICGIGKMKPNDYYTALKENNKAAFAKPTENIAKEAAGRIRERKLNLKPVEIREKADKSSGKVRMIGKESAMQQILDYIAVKASNSIWKRRIVPQQASSIRYRGQIYGTKMIQKWVQKDNRAERWARLHNKKYSRKCKYFVKLDVQKCYPSLRMEIFLKQFRRDCGNDTLLWLWEELLRSHRAGGYEGFMIGALPSQWGCQYIMSFIYRYAMGLNKERRGKTVKLSSHVLIYMDDIFITGSSRKDLKMAVRKIAKYTRDKFGLNIKPGWQIQEHDRTPVDMMGYVTYQNGTVTIRPRIFLRARRMALRCLAGDRLALSQAQRICAYKGYFDNSNSAKIKKRLKLDAVFRAASETVSRYERSKKRENRLQHETRYDPVHAPA